MEEDKKQNKVKAWFKENKDKIYQKAKPYIMYALGVGIGYYVGQKVTGDAIGRGLEVFHNDGLIKFFDPSTGTELKSAVEAGRFVSEYYNKKK